MTNRRGGRRPGAGAPKGNLNALRHGRHATDSDLRQLLATFTSEQRRALLPYLRASSRTIKRRLAWLPPPARYGAENVVPFPTSTTTTHAEQSNRRGGQGDGDQSPLRALALRLTSHGFVGAEGFVRAHSPAAPVIDAVLDHLDAMDDKTYRTLRNPGGLARAAIHEEIADRGDGPPRCPWCPWRSQERGERTS